MVKPTSMLWTGLFLYISWLTVSPSFRPYFLKRMLLWAVLLKFCHAVTCRLSIHLEDLLSISTSPPEYIETIVIMIFVLLCLSPTVWVVNSACLNQELFLIFVQEMLWYLPLHQLVTSTFITRVFGHQLFYIQISGEWTGLLIEMAGLIISSCAHIFQIVMTIVLVCRYLA